MSNMSREEFLRLQKEAELRLREMQKRSDEVIGKMPPAPSFVSLRNDEIAHEAKKSPPKSKTSRGFDLIKTFQDGNLKLDSDRVLVLAVMLLLIGESSDELLLLALLYIML